MEDKLTDTSGGPILTIEQVRAKILERHDRKEDHDKQNEVAFAAITPPAEARSDRRIKNCDQSSNQPDDAKPDVKECFFRNLNRQLNPRDRQFRTHHGSSCD